MKVDVCLIGDGFKVEYLKDYLNELPKFKYKLELIQEFGELSLKGRYKGKPSKYGFCWINGITLKQLKNVGSIFKFYKVDKISINIKEKDLKCQTCLYIDRELINIAHEINADIEIID
jgi:hypothetical protein